MSVHDETWDRCKYCKQVIKSWHNDEFHETAACLQFDSYGDFRKRLYDPTKPPLDLSLLPNADRNPLLKDTLAFRKEIEVEKNLIPNTTNIWRTDQPNPDSFLQEYACYWSGNPSNPVFPQENKEPQKQNFLILWTAFGQYEFVKDYHADPHEYAWGHDKYKISPYIIIPIEKLPKKFRQTPEDDLLDRTFGKQ